MDTGEVWDVHKRMGPLVMVAFLTGGLTACGAGEDSGASEGTVPESTQRIYLATALSCSMIDTQEARFTPLEVVGPDYTTTIEPTEGCEQQRFFSTYVYDVPVPATGEVTVTPGNQPGTTLDVEAVAVTDGVTVFYARKGDGEFEVSVISDGRDDEVGSAGS